MRDPVDFNETDLRAFQHFMNLRQPIRKIERVVSDKDAATGAHAPPGVDVALFERFMAGEDDALMELFGRHHHRIYLYCLKMVSSREAAEDLAQEVWERIIRYRDENRQITAPISYMLTIARNLCLNHIRANKKFSSLDDLPESLHPSITTPELTHMEELVALSLPKLSPAQREVLVLNAYCGYRFEDIAAMTGEPTGTIRMRASRARAHLARIVATMIGLDEDREKDGKDETRRSDND